MENQPETRQPDALAPIRYAVERHRSVTKFLAKHHDLLEAWPEVERELTENPYPRSGSDLISHLKGAFLCNYRIRDGSYRYLYEIFPEQIAVWVYDMDVRGQVYR